MTIEQRFRHFLVWVAVFILFGTLFELFLLEHWEKNVQYLPFTLSIIGILVLITARLKPTKGSVLTLRWVMVIVALGSLVGMYFHFSHNLIMVQYRNPSLSFSNALWPAVKGGAPLLAPGILFLAGVLGIAVTYKHPKLKNVDEPKD